ncbi:MAG: flagellar FlbD family protein [Bacillota bacterium]
MIKVTRFNGSEITVNSDLIEFIEETPDTVITLLNGKKLVIRESADEVIDRIVAFRQRSGTGLPRVIRPDGGDDGLI